MSFLGGPSVIPAQAGISKMNDNNYSPGLAAMQLKNDIKVLLLGPQNWIICRRR